MNSFLECQLQEWEAQKQVNTPALCAKVVNAVVASVRQDATTPAIPRDGIMQMRAAGMRFAAMKHISRSKNSAAAEQEGVKLLDEALAAERSAARGEGQLLARVERRAKRLELLRARGMLTPGDIACYNKTKHGDGAIKDSDNARSDAGCKAESDKMSMATVRIHVAGSGEARLTIQSLRSEGAQTLEY